MKHYGNPKMSNQGIQQSSTGIMCCITGLPSIDEVYS